MKPSNLAASVRERLRNSARGSKQDFNRVLQRYALERLLYRISISQYSEQFLLKGALLFDLWFDIPHRPTKDADFLGFGSAARLDIEEIFKNICGIEEPDGMAFQAETVKAAEIREAASYSGVRVQMIAFLDDARCHLQVDIGFGDAVTPSPEIAEYPVMLPGSTKPKLRVYPKYTVVAEKLEALSTLGIANSRMKDYFDLWILAQRAEFEGDTLRQAIRATFDRRKTPLAARLPLGLTAAFAEDTDKQGQWQAFLRKNKLDALDLSTVVAALAAFMLPVIRSAHANEPLLAYWRAGGPWDSAEGNQRGIAPAHRR